MTFDEKVDAGLIYKAGDEWVDTDIFMDWPICDNCPADSDEYIDICSHCTFNKQETDINKICEHYKRINTEIWFKHLNDIKKWYRKESKTYPKEGQ